MDRLTKDDIRQLVDYRGGPCMSIYMPTYRKGPDTQQNAIRFKNLISKAEEELIDFGIQPEERTGLLQPAQELLDDPAFWQHQHDWLAFFRSSGILQSYRLPLDFEELVVIGNRFLIKPLLSLIKGDSRFYILALDLNRSRLLQCTRFEAREMDLKTTPTSLAEALKYDDPERQLQFHTGAGKAKGRRAAVFHGQGKGVGIDDTERKKNIGQFFQMLDKGIKNLLTDHNAPLVLAGVEYLIPLYREANSYPCLMGQAVSHNPQDLSDQQLCKQALHIVQPHFQQGQERDAKKYQDLMGSGKNSNDIEEVVKEAHNKRVEALFLNKRQQVWGVFDGDRGEVQFHQEGAVGDEDLLDLAAVQTFINGGSVYSVSAEQMPDNADVAAVFRY